MAQFYKTKRIPYSKYQKLHENGQLMKPYNPSDNTKGREFMNTVLFPRFASFFKDGDKVYHIGKHGFWDYSLFFNNFEKRCEFIITDNVEEMDPDLVDDITKSNIESNSADGVTLVGMWEILPQGQLALDEIFRILKPGGRLLFSADIQPNQEGYVGADKSLSFQGFLKRLNQFLIDEILFVYDPVNPGWTKMYSSGKLEALFIIARKPEND